MLRSVPRIVFVGGEKQDDHLQRHQQHQQRQRHLDNDEDVDDLPTRTESTTSLASTTISVGSSSVASSKDHQYRCSVDSPIGGLPAIADLPEQQQQQRHQKLLQRDIVEGFDADVQHGATVEASANAEVPTTENGRASGLSSSASSTSLSSGVTYQSEASSVLHRRQRKLNFTKLLAERKFEILSRRTKFVLGVFAGGKLKFVHRDQVGGGLSVTMDIALL